MPGPSSKGQPVKNGTVFFMPDEGKGTIGPSAVGSLTSDGTYIMTTDNPGDGVILGQHKVGITGFEPLFDSGEVAYDPEKDPSGFMKAKAKTAAGAGRAVTKADEPLFTDKGGKKFRYVVPMKLSRPDESGIVVNVDRGMTVNFDIDEAGNVKVSP
jgi:hypothetical protein